MSATNKIRMSYQEVRDCAADIGRQAQSAEQMVKTLNMRVQQLGANWEGVAETEFMQQLQTCTQRLAKMSHIFTEVSRALRNTADIIERGEQQAKQRITGQMSSDA